MKKQLQLDSQVIVIIVRYHSSTALFLQCTKRSLRALKDLGDQR